MFQFAFAEYLKKYSGMDYIFDVSSFSKDKLRKYELEIFGLQKRTIGTFKKNIIKVMCRMGFVKEYYEKKIFIFDNETVLQADKLIYFNGYWQSHHYTDLIRQELIHSFVPTSDISRVNSKITSEIILRQSVAVHIRRGDYAENSDARNIHGLCTLEYYYLSINYIRQKIQDPVFYIFSDDSDWVKRSLNLKGKVYYISHNKGSMAYWDLMLMKKCKYFILANSTFSWWGAYLSEYQNKIVIAPEKWNNLNLDKMELIPDSWIRF